MLIETFVALFLFTSSVSTKRVQLIHFGKCENYHDIPKIVAENELEVSDGLHRKTVVKLDLQEDVNDIEAKLSIFKCGENNNPNNCTHFWKDKELKDICNKFVTNDVLDIHFKFIIDSTVPKITSCPVKKGIYETSFMNGDEFFDDFSLAPGIWTVKWTLLSNNYVISCYECQVNIAEKNTEK